MRYIRIALAVLLAACFLVAAVVATDGTPEPGQSGQPAANPLADEDPERNALSEREASLAARTRQLVNDYAKATGEDTRAKIKEELAGVVKEHFQLRQALREQELAELEGQVKRLRGLLDKRQEAQESIIDARLNQLLSPSEGLGWDEGQGDRSAAPADEQSISEMDFDIEGVVLDVWENRFLEISLGLEDGVRRGHPLIVHRDGKSLGTVSVASVHADRAVAHRRTGSALMKKGDRVARIPSRRDWEMLEGRWRIISIESEGKQLAEGEFGDSSQAFTFTRGAYFVEDGSSAQPGSSYVLDAKQQRILFRQHSGQEVYFFGRYKFDGDRLLLAISNRTTPAEMASKPGSDVEVYTLERIPEGTRKADPTPAGKDASAGVGPVDDSSEQSAPNPAKE